MLAAPCMFYVHPQSAMWRATPAPHSSSPSCQLDFKFPVCFFLVSAQSAFLLLFQLTLSPLARLVELGKGSFGSAGCLKTGKLGLGHGEGERCLVFFYSSFQEEAWSVCVFAELSCHHVLAYVLSKGWGRGSHQETYVLGWQHWEQTMLCSFQPTADQDDSHSAAF